MNKLKTDKKTLREFGVIMFAALNIICGIIFFKHRVLNLWLMGTGSLFLIIGIIRSNLLKPIYILWMKLAFVLGWINTRILLAAMFYLVVTPIGLVLKLFGKDLLDRRIEVKRDSYWQKKEYKAFKQTDYERQF